MNSTTAMTPVPPPSCIEDFNFTNFTHYTTIPAVIIILILAFLERRKQKKDTCNGRPALIVPLHLLDGYEDRFAFAVAFGAVTNDILNLFIESRNAYPFDYPLWAVAVILQIQALEVTITCFPLFACIATRHKLVGSVCGLLYSTLLCVGLVTRTAQAYCITADDGKGLKVMEVVRIIPVILCYLYLMFRSVGETVKAVLSKIYTLQANTDTVRPHQAQHVRLLLKGYYNDLILKEDAICDKVSYSSIKGFKYPVKIVSVVFIIMIVLYQLVTVEIFVGGQINVEINKLSRHDYNKEITIFNVTVVFLSPEVIDGMLAVYYSSAVVSAILAVIHMYFFMKVYRKNILRVYRGDRSFMMGDIPKSHYLMASNLRFPGYQVAYSLWGTVIAFLNLLLIGFVICYGLFFMAANDFLLSFLSTIAQLLSFPATTLLIFYIQVLLSKYVLLQARIHKTDLHPPINIDNRRFYEDFNFFTLFGSLAIGVFSCLFRILIGSVTGILMVGRLDKSTFMRDTEAFDKGHLCYISMLHVDNAHNHPVLRVFCGILWDRALERREHQTFLLGRYIKHSKYRTFPSVESDDDDYTHQTEGGSLKRQTSVFSDKRMLRKWNVAYTLLRNPSLKKFRKSELSKVELSQKISATNSVSERELTSVQTWDTERYLC